MAVSTVIIRNDKVLVLRRSDNKKWNFPGGKVEPGENIAEAASREVLEETGLEVRPTRVVHVFSNATDDGGTFVFIMFHVRLPITFGNDNVKLNPEHSEYRWVTEPQLSDEIAPDSLPRLEAFSKSERVGTEGIWHRDVTEYDWYPGERPKIGKARNGRNRAGDEEPDRTES